MMRFILIGALFVACVIGFTMMGCGPRAQVAADKVVEQIDKVLGELNVKQKSIQMKYDELKEATATVRDQRIETQVRLERLNEEKTNLEESLAKMKENLRELKPRIEEAKSSGKFVNDNGKEFTVDELNSLAQSIVKSYKNVETKLTTRIKTLHDVLSNNMTTLTNQEKVAAENLERLSQRLEEIAQKKAAIDAIKEASKFAGPNTSINDKFAELNKEVEDLLTDMDITFKKEEIKMSDLQSEAGETSIDITDVLEGSAVETDNTLSDIDSIIGG